MSGSYFQPIKREFLNLSGGTVTGDTVFTQGLYANSLSGGTLFSGSTNLEDIFLTAAEISGTTLSEGSNISLQQTGIDYQVSVVDSPSFNHINYSGISIGGNSIATNVSATTGFYSAGTSLETIIYNIANSTEDITNVQPGSNITTGGTAAIPIISLVDSPSINNITFSGSAIGNVVSANTISASTIYSGSTNLYSIFSTHDYYTTGATFNAPTKVATFNRNDGDSYTLNLSALTTVDTYITGFTYNPSSNILTIKQNEGQSDLTATINSFSSVTITGLTVNSTTQFNGSVSVLSSLSANTIYSGSSNLSSIFVDSVIGGSNVSIGGSSAHPIVNVVSSPSFNGLTLSGSANLNTLVVNSTSQLNGLISSGSLSGSTDRMVQVSSGGTMSASKQIISAYIVSGGSIANILENENNWDLNGDFIGSGITGTYMGQKHYNYNYFFEAIEDNQWIRLIRG